MGFDATRKLRGEGYSREWPELVRMSDEAQRLVDQLRNKTG
jgi:3-polyprenyl-4-hydroxybenzoate decarboxylase